VATFFAFAFYLLTCGVAAITMFTVLKRADPWLRDRTRGAIHSLALVVLFVVLFLGGWLPAGLYLLLRGSWRRVGGIPV
jgi:hypothetical protein